EQGGHRRLGNPENGLESRSDPDRDRVHGVASKALARIRRRVRSAADVRPRDGPVARGCAPSRTAAEARGGRDMASTSGQKIFPHLWYAKEAEEAARFYASIFPDSRVDRVTALMSESPSWPPAWVKLIEFTL